MVQQMKVSGSGATVQSVGIYSSMALCQVRGQNVCTLLLLGNFSRFFLSSADCFQNQLFR